VIIVRKFVGFVWTRVAEASERSECYSTGTDNKIYCFYASSDTMALSWDDARQFCASKSGSTLPIVISDEVSSQSINLSIKFNCASKSWPESWPT